jgi:nicotinamide-nucleotide amidase
MKAEIISVGSEITSGQCLDTNGQWLSLRLGEIGIPVGWHTIIADDLQDNVDAFRLASSRAQLVIITGGLGPTLDDLTRDALANAAGVDLVFHPESFEKIRDMFARRRRTMPERNRVQAMFPQGSEPIPNERGTAPGIFMRLGCAIVIAMPGVPSEMFAMYELWARPRLLELGLGGGVQIQRKINCFGAGESHIEEKLADLTKRGYVPEVGITASDATISLRILARASSLEAAQQQIAPIERTIRERLGQYVFGADDQELQDVVVELLNAKGLTLAAAEDITGGVMAQRITAIAGSERCFPGAVEAVDDRVKTAILGVPADVIREHGTVSPQVAEMMAVGCRKLFGSDMAVSTVGILRPEKTTNEKPIGTTWVGLAWEGGVSTVQFGWIGTAKEIQSRGAKMALNLVRLKLLV